MRIVQHRQRMDGGRGFSWIVSENPFQRQDLLEGGSDRRDPIWDLAYRNAGEKLYERRNVIFRSRLDGDRLYDPFWRYGDQMGIALPYDRDRKSVV